MPHTLIAGFRSFRYLPTPLTVPPVPTPDDELGDPAVRLVPDLGPGLLVVRLGFDGLSYWFAFQLLGTSFSRRDETE